MKRIIVSIVLLFTILLVGCDEKQEKDRKLDSIADHGIETVEKPKGVTMVTDVDKFVIVTDDQKYDINRDDSLTVRSEYSIAESENAYYFVEGYSLYFYDKETEEYLIACNKPDCEHADEGEECNAYICTNDYNAIQYYDGYIYYVVRESNDFNLYRKSVEAGTTEKVLNIVNVEQRASGQSNMQICWILHRGYIYYVGQFGSGITEDSYYLNYSNCLARIKLEADSKSEILMALPAECMMINPHLVNIQASGSYVYFVSPYYNEKVKDMVSDVYRYNTEANHIERLDIGEVSWMNYIVSENRVYYKRSDSSDRLYAYDVNTNTSKEFVRTEDGKDISSILPYKGGIMATIQEDCCYGKDGNLENIIESIENTNVDKCLYLGGDKEKVFFQVDYTLEYAQEIGMYSSIAYYDMKTKEYVILNK
ncbi:MAG: hypothetical protein J6L69_06935 [Lachnospiraceae bacterium]|nr:hypothetical protein [Lachnospiraceae bacterium]